MTKEDIAECIKVMQAYVEGKQIQYVDSETEDWTDIESPIWNWDIYDYRVKPEPKYRPFKNADECWQEMLKHKPFGWIKCKEGYFNIVYVNDDYVGLADKDGCSILLASKNSHQDNTFVDGTPFGIKEEH